MPDERTTAGPGPSSDEEGVAEKLPLALRILGTLGIAGLIVALYAVVQLVSSDDGPASTVDIGLGQEIRPPGAGDPPTPGVPAPDFTVPTLDGGEFSLSRHLADDGRPVLVNMWAEWCFPCREEMPAIDAVSRNHPEVHFIGVVVRDEAEPARRFVEEYGISYQIGIDDQGAVEDDYFVWVMPSTYLIGADGVIVDRFFGPMDEEAVEKLISSLDAS